MKHSPFTPQHRPVFEGLESRRMLSVTTDAAGWTVVGKSADTRVVYVSSSGGSDTNTGLSESAPVRTIAKAKSLLRGGMPDHLLLKRGDVWTEGIGWWALSGRSASEPMLIGTYGTAAARPVLRTGTATGMDTDGRAVSHLILQGISFHAHTRDPGFTSAYASTTNHGIRFVGSSVGFLVEDCAFDSYGSNVTFDDYAGTISNVTFRRNVVTDAWDAAGKAVGLYSDGVHGLTLEGNVFDHNGWHETAVGGAATMFSHNVYLQSGNSNVVVRDNVIANAASHGLQARAGGQVTGNLFLKNPIHMSFGHVNGGPVKPGGVSGQIAGNVFLESRDINGSKRGWAIEIGNTRPGGGTVIRDNVIANDTQWNSAAIHFEIGSGLWNPADAVGINDLTIENNVVYKWFQSLGTNGGFVNGGTGAAAYNDVVVRNNDFQLALDTKHVTHAHAFSPAAAQWSGNRYYDESATSGWFSLQWVTTSLDAWRSKVEATAVNQRVAYADPTRTAATYMGSIGGTASLSSYLSAARAQSKTNWRDNLAAGDVATYVRAGFVDTSVAPAPGPEPDTAAPTATFSAVPITTAGGTSHTLSVTYADNVGIDASTIDGSDVKVTLPNGATFATTLVSVSSTADGTPRTATYRVNAPGGTWDSADNGTYTASLQAGQVADVAGNYAAAKTLGTFSVSVAAPAPEPEPTPPPTSDTTSPTVESTSFDSKASRMTIRFSENVSGSFGVSDVVIRNRSTEAVIAPSAMAVSYDAATNTAVLTFPGLSGGVLPDGRYSMTLTAGGITDGAGNALDGDNNGTAGGDFTIHNFRQR